MTPQEALDRAQAILEGKRSINNRVYSDEFPYPSDPGLTEAAIHQADMAEAQALAAWANAKINQARLRRED